VNAIHDAGVIHCDLFLSNVMWKHDAHLGTDIKIIDWDCSHTIDEGKFHPKIEHRLRNYFGMIGTQPVFGIAHDDLYLRILEVDHESHRTDWEELASNEKSRVDQAFRNLLVAVVQVGQS
jgi:serine/threonine protein kinase